MKPGRGKLTTAGAIEYLRFIRKLFTLTRTSALPIAVAALIAVGAALFEGASLGLLMPMVQGLIAMDFSAVAELPLLRYVAPLIIERVSEPNIPLFALLASVIFASAAAYNSFAYYAAVQTQRQVVQFRARLQQLIFGRYLSFGKQFFDGYSLGHLSTVLIQYTNQIATSLVELQKFFQGLVLVVTYVALLVMISWEMTLFVICLIPVLLFSSSVLIGRIRSLSIKLAERRTELNRKVSTIIMMVPLIKVSDREEEERAEFERLNAAMAETEIRSVEIQRLLTPIQELIVLTSVLLLLCVVAIILSQGSETPVTNFLVAFLVLRRATSRLGDLNQLRSAVARSEGPKREIEVMLGEDDKYPIEGGDVVLDDFTDSIELRNLTFRYAIGRTVLDGLSVSFAKGKVTALVGETGAGKSTIVHLLLRLYECPPGTIFVDGHDVRALNTKSLRSRMAFVSQDPLIFNGTIRENIEYGAGREVDDATVEDAIHKARLDKYVAGLPDGLDTLVGDRGVRLSGGEKQRLAIARAFLKDASILLLDEATSALDSKTERLIQEAVDEVIADRTAIVVAHRLSTIQHADQIVVLESGKVVEQGDLQALLARKGKFHELWEEQRFV